MCRGGRGLAACRVNNPTTTTTAAAAAWHDSLLCSGRVDVSRQLVGDWFCPRLPSRHKTRRVSNHHHADCSAPVASLGMGLWGTYFSLYFGQEIHIFLAILEAFCGLKHAENAISALFEMNCLLLRLHPT